MATENLEALIEAARQLTTEEQQKLVRALHPQLKVSESPSHITELRGFGKGIMAGS